jgi:hypothetical protein
MATAEIHDLGTFYERDETAWLDAMSVLAATGRYAVELLAEPDAEPAGPTSLDAPPA